MDNIIIYSLTQNIILQNTVVTIEIRGKSAADEVLSSSFSLLECPDSPFDAVEEPAYSNSLIRIHRHNLNQNPLQLN